MVMNAVLLALVALVLPLARLLIAARCGPSTLPQEDVESGRPVAGVDPVVQLGH
jgi:hypothetical protein